MLCRRNKRVYCTWLSHFVTTFMKLTAEAAGVAFSQSVVSDILDFSKGESKLLTFNNRPVDVRFLILRSAKLFGERAVAAGKRLDWRRCGDITFAVDLHSFWWVRPPISGLLSNGLWVVMLIFVR